ncbi:dTDP-4-amino-4,6-dideoxygalactose transaminase [Arthrobacter ulcerisalmonis]|uniref:DegT/DnrJ/EryC1/StrS family aminotransferase n=1 Tax=Arthrobacter sp. B1I2 TaxID=3042263 RepID=UPI0027830665|nr:MULTISPECIES: DegT/DnrJ/EryC1/StrS family aminotransferase [Arthrobacter]MDQ0662298.1 dTDP-4-amino-4,6-dideoxygalactose transaminase [Arthrobacter ulcerisalmonis]MDQ0730226.1 dTDP-4-amino-4,6-dideoxygalactose transaminase [Arthrobacter sp. B1I2]
MNEPKQQLRVPLVDITAQQEEIREELEPQLLDILTRAAFIGGKEVELFEQQYAEFLGARHCIGSGNGTDALEMALSAAGVGPGQEVIVPANTFIATVEAVLRIGARPVLADVDQEHLLLDPESVRKSVTSRTAAIIPVHLFGQVAPVERLVPIAEEFGAVIIEDAAQAQGATRFNRAAGTLGHLAATSFYPGKNLGAAGDAGAVTTDDDAAARHVRLLGAHGSEHKYQHEIMGRNSRLDTIQAAVLSCKLRRLAGWNELRREAATNYHHLLADIDQLKLPWSSPGNSDVWHLFVVRLANRDVIADRLEQAGISTAVHYPVPIHRTNAWKRLGLPCASFPVAELAARQILSIPIYPHITPEQQRRVATALKDALAGGSK